MARVPVTTPATRRPLGRLADSLANGWEHIRSRASRALTHFKPHDDEPGTDPVRWGFLAGDVSETDRDVVVCVESPGMAKADFHVAVEGEHLVVSGEKRLSREDRDGDRVIVERAFGSFRRIVPLPAEVDAEAATARYEDGVLRVTLPKKTPAKAGDTARIKVVAG